MRDFDEVAGDQQSHVRSMFPVVDGHLVTGTPVKLSGTPGYPTTGAPEPGEHTKSALAELLDLDEATIEDFTGRGVIA